MQKNRKSVYGKRYTSHIKLKESWLHNIRQNKLAKNVWFIKQLQQFYICMYTTKPLNIQSKNWQTKNKQIHHYKFFITDQEDKSQKEYRILEENGSNLSLINRHTDYITLNNWIPKSLNSFHVQGTMLALRNFKNVFHTNHNFYPEQLRLKSISISHNSSREQKRE